MVLDTFQEHLVTGSPWLFYSYNGNKVEVTVSFSNDYYNLNAIFYRSLTWAIRIVFVLFCLLHLQTEGEKRTIFDFALKLYFYFFLNTKTSDYRPLLISDKIRIKSIQRAFRFFLEC